VLKHGPPGCGPGLIAWPAPDIDWEKAVSEASNVLVSDNIALGILKNMVLCREVDLFIGEQLRLGRAAPHFHSGIGQEALSVAATQALRSDDYLMYSHRGYGQVLTRGLSLYELFADMHARIGGTNDGFGSIMHLYKPELGLMGRNSVFGTKFTITMGLALSASIDRSNRAAVCFFGEAEASRAPLYEALNCAVLWQLPMVLIAENNGYSFSSRTSDMFPEGRMMRVWEGWKIPVFEVDGNDAIEVYSTVTRALEYARSGRGPAIVEGRTYRIDAHFPADDPSLYRTPSEVKFWQARDPVDTMTRYLRARDLDFDADGYKRSVRTDIETAWSLALAQPSPSIGHYRRRMEELL
jgi:pyruvate dehydrogenase E1 component alpha subunit